MALNLSRIAQLRLSHLCSPSSAGIRRTGLGLAGLSLAPTPTPSLPTTPTPAHPTTLLTAIRGNRTRVEKKKRPQLKKKVPHIPLAPSPAQLAPTSTEALPRGLKLPSEMPSTWVLKQLTFKHPKRDFFPTLSNNVWRKPRISLRNQARIRKAALLCGIDPVKELGLPEKADNHGVRIITIPEGRGDVEKYQR